MAGYLIQISCVSLRSDDVNDLMERSFWVFFSICSCNISKNPIIRNFCVVYLRELIDLGLPRIKLPSRKLVIESSKIRISSFLLGLLFLQVLLS